MRIAWITPFAAGSALGAHSARVAGQLALSAEVDVWTADAGPLQPTPLRVLRIGPDGAPEDYDAVFDNLDGDASGAAARRAAIVILHRAAPPGGLPPRALGLVTHSPADALALAQDRLEPVRSLAPQPVEAYAAALVEFIAEVQRVTPALMLLDRVGAELATMRAAPGLAVFDAIAADFGRFLVL
jgi:hypothetical protein